MKLSINDIAFSDTLERSYNLGIFASGYEERSTHIPKMINKSNIEKSLIFGFLELAKHEQRKKNDLYFAENWPEASKEQIKADDDGKIYDVLQRIPINNFNKLKIFVDYSVMSRLWYAGILNWARYNNLPQEVELDMLYSIGDYKEYYNPVVIDEILALPGFEGGALNFDRSIAIFGLGFDGFMAQCVLEHLEPDYVYSIILKDKKFPKYVERARKNNEYVISESDKVIELPLASVQRTVKYLAEIIIPFLPQNEVILIPMGPKPQVLSSILISMQFIRVSCLRVSISRKKPEEAREVGAVGDIVATRISLIKD